MEPALGGRYGLLLHSDGVNIPKVTRKMSFGGMLKQR